MKQCKWRGISGIEYAYNIYPLNTDWDDLPGNFIITKETSPHRWFPIYIGRTKSFKDKLPFFSGIPCVKSQHPTHIHTHTNNSDSGSLIEERDLLDNYSMPCQDIPD
jgi:hypothetical protein